MTKLEAATIKIVQLILVCPHCSKWVPAGNGTYLWCPEDILYDDGAMLCECGEYSSISEENVEILENLS